MSRLDELIAELCPDGVEYKKIGTCCTLSKGQTPIQKAIPGSYPLVVTTSERKTSNIFQFDKPGVCIPLVSSRGHGVASINEIFYQEGKYDVGNILCCVVPLDDSILSARFLHVYLNYAKDILLVPQMKGGANVSLSIDAISRVKIPVPPIAVQQEIVRILDNFTELTAELTTELTARKKQYEYYKDMLLPFEDKLIPWLPLGEISTVSRGASPRPIKNYVTEDPDGINWIKIGDVAPEEKYITECAEKITEEGAKKSRFVKPGDFILSNSMSFGRPYILKVSGCIHDGWLSISGFEKYVTADYLYHVLTSNCIQKVMAQKASFGGAVHNLNADIVRNIEIPVPSLELQTQIVSILDRFALLCTDPSSGLPAEIAARQKQYEYYRDKLLTFKEKQ